MTYSQANILAQRIRTTHPDLHPVVRTIGNGEVIIRFETKQRKRTVGWYHLFCVAEWYSYLESLNHKSKRREAS
jgi:hypothetical protein